MINKQWQAISDSLRDIYLEQNILHCFKDDEYFHKNGFFTLDIFPFAFNPKLIVPKYIGVTRNPVFPMYL